MVCASSISLFLQNSWLSVGSSSTLEQGRLLRNNESRRILQVVREDTSSLLLLQDADSTSSRTTARTDNSQLWDSSFSFDREVLGCRAYQSAFRSNMRDPVARSKSVPVRYSDWRLESLELSPEGKGSSSTANAKMIQSDNETSFESQATAGNPKEDSDPWGDASSYNTARHEWHARTPSPTSGIEESYPTELPDMKAYYRHCNYRFIQEPTSKLPYRAQKDAIILVTSLADCLMSLSTNKELWPPVAITLRQNPSSPALLEPSSWEAGVDIVDEQNFRFDDASAHETQQPANAYIRRSVELGTQTRSSNAFLMENWTARISFQHQARNDCGSLLPPRVSCFALDKKTDALIYDFISKRFMENESIRYVRSGMVVVDDMSNPQFQAVLLLNDALGPDVVAEVIFVGIWIVIVSTASLQKCTPRVKRWKFNFARDLP